MTDHGFNIDQVHAAEASKKRGKIDIAEKLKRIDAAGKRADGTSIPLGEQCLEAADEIERLRASNAELVEALKYLDGALDSGRPDMIYRGLSKARAAIARAGETT